MSFHRIGFPTQTVQHWLTCCLFYISLHSLSTFDHDCFSWQRVHLKRTFRGETNCYFSIICNYMPQRWCIPVVLTVQDYTHVYALGVFACAKQMLSCMTVANMENACPLSHCQGSTKYCKILQCCLVGLTKNMVRTKAPPVSAKTGVRDRASES